MIRRLLLSAVSLGTLALVAAACSGGDEDGGPSQFDLTGGLYELTLSSVVNDLCWADDNLVPPLNVGAIDLLVSATGADVSVVPDNAARFYFQPVIGTRDGNDLVLLLGNGTLVVTSQCSVAVSTSGGGLVTGENQFDLSLTATLQAMSTGTAGGCAAFAGETWPGATVPFPTLNEPTNGSCTVSFGGTAVQPD